MRKRETWWRFRGEHKVVLLFKRLWVRLLGIESRACKGGWSQSWSRIAGNQS